MNNVQSSADCAPPLEEPASAPATGRRSVRHVTVAAATFLVVLGAGALFVRSRPDPYDPSKTIVIVIDPAGDAESRVREEIASDSNVASARYVSEGSGFDTFSCGQATGHISPGLSIPAINPASFRLYVPDDATIDAEIARYAALGGVYNVQRLDRGIEFERRDVQDCIARRGDPIK